MLKRVLWVLSLGVLLGMLGCDSGSGENTVTPIVIESTAVANEDIRPFPDAYTTRKAISYSGYRADQSPDLGIYPSEAEILEDLNLLNSMGFTLLRLYDTGTHAERVLNVINTYDLDIKIMLGVWIAGSIEEADSINKPNCDQAVAWANGEYQDIIIAVSIGNECMVDWNTFGWETPPAHIAHYVTYVRDQITQPVTVDDNWEAWSLENEQGTEFYADVKLVAEAVDFIAMHTYAVFDTTYDLWAWEQIDVSAELRAEAMMDAAIDYTMENYTAVKTAMTGIGIDKPIIIGETGWRSRGDDNNVGHPVNQQMYHEKLSDRVYNYTDSPEACVFFEAFDEPWKSGDDGWGYFNVDREAKYIVYSNSEWFDPATMTKADDVDYTASDAAYYVAPLLPLEVDGNVTDTFYIFADDVSGGYDGQLWDEDENSIPESVNLLWESWESNSTGTCDVENATANSEDTEAGSSTDTVAVITPDPLGWGWGMMALLDPQGFDLSDFAAGNLRFRMKTSYTGTIEVGLQTGLSGDNDSMDWLVLIDPESNSYGYLNDGAWHDIVIPIADLNTVKKLSYSMSGPGAGLEKVFVPFVVADRDTPIDSADIWIDQVRWTID
jgi:exo-beta-1,3-glucanase (GH17 family)